MNSPGPMVREPACRRLLAARLPVRAFTLLPIQPIDTVALVQITQELRSRGVKVELKPAVLRPRDSYDARRQQFRADRLLERVALTAERPVLGVTDGDCYAGRTRRTRPRLTFRARLR
jgi:hypothetical protein